MILSVGIFVIVWRVLCLALLALVLTELTWAQKHDGEALKALRGVIMAQMFVLAFPLVAAVDSYTDISPGFQLRPALEAAVWIAYATLAGCLLRFWLALHTWARKQREEKSDRFRNDYRD